ncbi:cytosolic phospholipase A2 gamma-like protein [Labeo rohita]|uniref:Cytosolic phospholipase A2 gamma-like protein n=1 Tax=Labeo rohita TaxID=84645 RepID=A0A498NZ87_LABRO|nr:cytosolic phospholipase A2 gamma-like protein [Labeo rohita]
MSETKPQKRGEVRIKPLLNGSEQEFIASRRNIVFQTLEKLQIQCSQDEVPNIALLGSGGGQRAMVGLLGSLVQLDKAGLLDCILYLSGVSGSTCGEVRIKHSLNKNEEEFVARRRNTVLQCLQKFKIRCSQNAVPNIALLGSGGGQRAMVGLLGSLVELNKAGLLDCILYLSGISGSTWCMASLYQEPDWSTKLETVKDKIIKRLSGPGVSWVDVLAKLYKYYYGKDLFSLTDIWAVMLVTSYVKEIDERTLTNQWKQQSKDPFPIYAVIDKHCKQREEGDPWFEVSPHEAGYSLTGAFVDASNFGSQFDKGSKKNHQDVFDMLYLQAVCSSTLADEVEIWKWIKDFLLSKMKTASQKREQDLNTTPVDDCYQVLMNLADMNLAVLKGTDPSTLEQSIRTKITDISGGQRQLFCQVEKIKADKTTDKKAAKLVMSQYTMDVCNYFSLELKLSFWPFDLLMSIFKCIAEWTWGRNYNFLHNMTDEAVPTALLQNETRDYIDAGLLNNSPYFSVLRDERDIDVIISLDFSESDPFLTVKETAKTCRKLNIPFPEVSIPSEDEKKPKDFYVFKGKNVPTVIHIPLFNVVNCGGKLTFSSCPE